MVSLDIQLASMARPILQELSPAGKIALAITLIQEVAAEVPSKPVNIILTDLEKVLKSSPLRDGEDSAQACGQLLDMKTCQV